MQEKNKKIILITWSVLLPLVTAGALFFGAKSTIKPSKADNYHVTLDNTCHPTLDNTGEGTLVDAKEVTWEYHGAKAYAAGHVSLDNGGYFGVSSITGGYTKITNISISFSSGSDGELWLLNSINGTDWGEAQLLKASTDETSTSATSVLANGYRYIRFFFDYDTDNDSIDIDSVTVNYDCVGVSASEDVDLAHASSVKSCSFLNYFSETTLVSPLGDSTEALRLENTAGTTTKDHICNINLERDYTVGEIKTRKIEFDYYHTDKRSTGLGYPKVILLRDNGTVGSAQGGGTTTTSNSSFIATDINENWWHLEYFITSIAPTMADYSDKAIAENTKINGIRIIDNAIYDHDSVTGMVVVDNLRLGTTQTTRLGIFNNGTSFGVNDENPYWVKVAWTGILREVDFAFDNPIATRAESTKSKFYIWGTAAGSLVVTATLKVGYNKRTVVVNTNTLTITES